MFLSGVLSKRDGRAEEPDVDGVALAHGRTLYTTMSFPKMSLKWFTKPSSIS